LVNLPSWLNSCPAVPPAPVECGGMTPLWHRETCLPVDRATLPARGGDGPVPTFPSIGRVPVRPDQAKKPGNQTKSNQIKPPPLFASFAVPRRLSDLRNPKSVPESAQSRQKPQQSRLIVPHQASSSQTANSRSASVPGRSNDQTHRPLRSGHRPAPFRPHLRSSAFIGSSTSPVRGFRMFRSSPRSPKSEIRSRFRPNQGKNPFNRA